MNEQITKKKIICDVAVVGGGPAGMMAAIFAAKEGAKVVLVEKNKTLGKKLLITGGGRCNVTNALFDNRALSEKYGKKGKFLLSPFSKWNAKDTIEFFENHGMPTKIENENRVFPESNTAKSVWEVLVNALHEQNVKILCGAQVTKVISSKNRITTIETDNATISANSFIFTTGGTARPETGSTGDGFKWLKKLGHTINTPDVALVPVKTKEAWTHKLQGLSLGNVGISLIENGVKHAERVGKILFTHYGLSGPLVLNMSRTIGEALREGTLLITLDLFPLLNEAELDEKLRAHLTTVQNKKWQNALAGFVSPLLAPVLVELSAIDANILVNKITRASRLAFVKKLKSLEVTPTSLLSQEKAIVSSGGVALDEVDFRSMQSHKIENLYLAGDILDFERPSGGFSLQICWSTGFIAGQNSAKSIS